MTRPLRSARRDCGIEQEVVDAKDFGRLGERRAAKERAQPSEQLAQREWLDDVVVGSRVETGDAIGHFVSRGQHEDR